MFESRSIRAKLIGIMVVTTSAALVLASLAFGVYDSIQFKQQNLSELSTEAEMLGAINSAALNFDDAKAAQEYLAALSVRPNVVSAAIYDAQGRVFATYQRSGSPGSRPPEAEPAGHRIEGDDLLLFKPIRVGQQTLGMVHLRANMGLRARALHSAGIVLSVVLGALLIAVILSARLQTLISRPLLDVTRIARGVVECHDYSLRATKRSQDEVGVLVDAFNQMLGQIQLRETALQAANQELEAFSYSVSHDLRAPVRAMTGFAQILEQDLGPRLDGEGKRLVGVIQSEGRRMGQLIDDLLAFSKINRQSLGTERVDMGGLVREVVQECLNQVRGEVPVLELEPMPLAEGDRAMLKEVWTNLLSNAMKYTIRQATPRIRVGGSAHAEELWYFVQDNGVGFDMKYYDKLFGVFQRLHSASEFPGTGVGLAIVKRIITRHGGRVWAESVLGEGATFHFTLPFGASNA